MAGLITGISGAVLSAGTTAASFIQAGNQKRKQQQFEADAARALAEARKKLQVNYAEAMSINKEPYNQERLAMLTAGAQIAQAAAESKRGVSAAAGQLLAQQQNIQQDISNRQGIDMQNIQNAVLEEESRLRDINVGLDVQELAGQQQAAADAKFAAQVATQQGIQGIGNTVGKLINEDMIPLYGFPKKDTTTISDNVTTLPEVVITAKKQAPTNNTQVAPIADANKVIQNQSIQNDSKVLSAEAFTSPEQAAELGYEFDAILGGYVKKQISNINLPPGKRIYNTNNSGSNSFDAFNINLEGKI